MEELFFYQGDTTISEKKKKKKNPNIKESLNNNVHKTYLVVVVFILY